MALLAAFPRTSCALPSPACNEGVIWQRPPPRCPTELSRPIPSTCCAADPPPSPSSLSGSCPWIHLAAGQGRRAQKGGTVLSRPLVPSPLPGPCARHQQPPATRRRAAAPPTRGAPLPARAPRCQRWPVRPWPGLRPSRSLAAATVARLQIHGWNRRRAAASLAHRLCSRWASLIRCLCQERLLRRPGPCPGRS